MDFVLNVQTQKHFSSLLTPVTSILSAIMYFFISLIVFQIVNQHLS